VAKNSTPSAINQDGSKIFRPTSEPTDRISREKVRRRNKAQGDSAINRHLLMRVADAFVLLDFLDEFRAVCLGYPKNFLVGGLVRNFPAV
jgi:hypothetical protein